MLASNDSMLHVRSLLNSSEHGGAKASLPGSPWIATLRHFPEPYAAWIRFKLPRPRVRVERAYGSLIFYTFCPEVCPTTLTELAQWIRMLGPDADKLNYVFVTVDPERDTPKVMHDYVSAFDPRIRGFTGTPDQIAKVTSEYRVYYKRVPTSDGGYVIDHTAALYLMDPKVKFFGFIPYQEKTDAAVAKLRKLAAASASS